MGVLYLNPDPYCRFIGPKNLGEALIDKELATCLLDNGAQLNFITPAYAHEWGMDTMSLESLAQEVGGCWSSPTEQQPLVQHCCPG